MADEELATTDDAVLGGALRLRQPRRGHRVGHDAILLAASCPLEPGDSVVDLGAGVGAVGLARPASRLRWSRSIRSSRRSRPTTPDSTDLRIVRARWRSMSGHPHAPSR